MALPLPGYTPATPPALTPPALPSPPAGKPLLPDLGPSASPVTPPAPLNVTPPVLEPTARPTTFLKPIDPPVTQPVAFTPEVKPLAVSQSAPKTSFDVDLHSVKASDTYASICREHYNNDAKYEVALKQFNGGRALPNSGSIEIPPIHVLRKQFPGSITTGRAAGSAEWVAPITPVVNATPQPAATEFRASRSGSYTVPAGGATLKAIARSTLGSDHRWNEIWDMNPKLVRADDTVPAGTVLNLPSDARIP